MSLDSNFFLDAAGVTALQVQAQLIGTGYFERLDDGRNAKRLFAPGCILTISPPFDPRRDDLRDVGIKATLQFYFANSDNTQTQDWTLNTIRAVVSLLQAHTGDALFIYSSDSPALLRKYGALILDRRCGVWLPEVEPHVLPLIEMPYTWGIIPIT